MNRILMQMKIKAYAKINLGLRILQKRTDGFHDIETVFHRINLFDELDFLHSDAISMECDDPDILVDSSNLCIRAAILLKTRIGITRGVHIKLKKNIPVGAGLGGGSSDAAAVLLHLPKFWGFDINKSVLNELALNLGSDVPYFLEDGSAYATGRGEKLVYFKLDFPYWVLMVYPGIHVSTAWAYQSIKLITSRNERDLKALWQEYIHSPNKLNEYIKNDFESCVFEKYQQIKKLKISLYESGANFVQMSGSGSSVYAFFKEENTAISSELLLSKEYKTFLTEPNFHPTI